MLLKIN